MKASFACATVASLSLVAVAAQADSASCRAELLAAFQKSLAAPNHTYTSQVGSGLNVTSEMINIGNKSYIKLNPMKAGKMTLGGDGWAVSRVSPQDSAKMVLDSYRHMDKDVKSYQCAHVKDEIIDGVAAALYKEHVEQDDVKADSETWISKAQGLVTRVQVTADVATTTTRYVYTDVAAPPNPKPAD